MHDESGCSKSEIPEFSSQTDAVVDQAHKGDIHAALDQLHNMMQMLWGFYPCR